MAPRAACYTGPASDRITWQESPDPQPDCTPLPNHQKRTVSYLQQFCICVLALCCTVKAPDNLMLKALQTGHSE